jgi:hypothetical protein
VTAVFLIGMVVLARFIPNSPVHWIKFAAIGGWSALFFAVVAFTYRSE